MKSITLLTLFPEVVETLHSLGVVGQALQQQLLQLEAVDIRQFAINAYGTVDDRPYGGGPGMVMRVEPLVAAIRSVKAKLESDKVKTVFLSPQGDKLDHAQLQSLLQVEHLILLAGRYEGIDERVNLLEVDQEISIGDYVLTGGDLPAMVLIDALVRLLPGVLGNAESAEQDCFQNNQLSHAQYTRPVEFEGLTVPAVLRSGRHRDIEQWRAANRQARTLQRRPDLLG